MLLPVWLLIPVYFITQVHAALDKPTGFISSPIGLRAYNSSRHTRSSGFDGAPLNTSHGDGDPRQFPHIASPSVAAQPPAYSLSTTDEFRRDEEESACTEAMYPGQNCMMVGPLCNAEGCRTAGGLCVRDRMGYCHSNFWMKPECRGCHCWRIGPFLSQ
ncbi:hypothetical protein PHLGIDRAFT_307527 [Phlebiopsis gigantea 11061_1 CR5-6]|uniref:Uncharacterized protein n=1 Tax=Phlebiopsis gigantea (strain 11061_1 CR5-6) TaxID=745531 RepID=A0A0C3NW98_PHLG1|nr:hypothetical protein PHLGIDRAFT_307527 [Phlebiopsis gigantea 11061_1 CR5-6]